MQSAEMRDPSSRRRCERRALFCFQRRKTKKVLLFGPMRASLFTWILSIGLIVLSSTIANSQTVQGKVLNESNEPIVGAFVTNGVVVVGTGMDGSYSMKLKPGTHIMTCSIIGMNKEEFTVELSANQTVEWNPVMTFASESLGYVVVSAGRFEQEASEVTMSLEVLKPALVENKATTSLETAIEQTPGVSLVDGEPQIRSGSGFSYGAGSRVMVLVDDLPVLSGDAGRPTWGFLPLRTSSKLKL